MNNFLQLDFHYIIWWFWMYSFLGWVFECIYSSLHENRIINRGFVKGPVCTIYGIGAIFIILSLSNFKDNILLLFFMGVIITSALEYIVYIILDKVFNQKWWDYTDMRFHYKGILSLESSIAWGILSVILIKVLHPLVMQIIKFIDIKLGEKALIVITIVYIVDFILSCLKAIKKSESPKMIILRVKTEAVRILIVEMFRRKK